MTLALAAEMASRGHQATLAIRHRPIDQFADTLDGVEVIECGIISMELTKAGVSDAPDIVHAVDLVHPDFAAAALDAARSWGSAFVVTPASALETWLEIEAGLNVCRSADVVYVLTDAERERFEKAGVPRTRLVVVGQGLPLDSADQSARLQNSPDPTRPIILFLGRKIESKGYRQLLAAAPLVWQSCPAARFVFIGPRSEPECQKAFEKIRDPRISELDTVSNPEKYEALINSAILCLPTTADVFPIVFLEAWACNVPIVTTLFPGVEEIIEHGETGLIVERTPQAIAAALTSLLLDPEGRARMGARGRARIDHSFNWANVSDRIEQSYLHLLSPRGAT